MRKWKRRAKDFKAELKEARLANKIYIEMLQAWTRAVGCEYPDDVTSWLERNHDIVDSTKGLLAAAKTLTEKLRG